MRETIVRRFLADLQPALGKPGGPCSVVRRIEDEVSDPSLKRDMIQEVMNGEDLSNPEAAKVYDLDREMTGNKSVKRLEIGPHAQYRMDLRGITVDDLRDYFQEFVKRALSGKVQSMADALAYGTKTEWVEPKSKLLVVFQVHQGLAKIITTYWRDRQTPTAPASGCSV